MFSKSPLRLAIAALIATPVCVHAEIEVSAELRNETSFFTESGPVTGQARTTAGSDGHQQGDLMKFENSARIFINGDLAEESSWHAELRPVVNTAGTTADYKYHRSYTQDDYLREAYVDTAAGDWDFRLGKQQVVWGTADGIKLLDIINPTDFRELNQNAMEDARIPVWMINAETNIGESSNVQLILSQAETNKIAGLWTQDDSGSKSRRYTTAADNTSPTGYSFVGNDKIQGQDRGHPFIMQGVDVITGGVNGFFNIGAAFGSVTNTFALGGFTNPAGGLNPFGPEFATVDRFVAGTYNPTCNGPGSAVSGALCLEFATESTNNNITNLIDVDPATGTGWNVTKPNSAWEHFPNATLATFNSMVGMTTRYDRDYDDGDLPTDANLGGRFRSSLDNGLNYSVNYFYAYDSNPSLNMHWENSRGEKLVVDKRVTAGAGSAFNPGTRDVKTIQIRNAAGTEYYGTNVDFSPLGEAAGLQDVTNMNNGGNATLVFVEDRERIHNLGSSFDYATEAVDIPLVIRGEFLYQKDVKQPVVDRGALADGDLVAGLKSKDADFFKYVIGLDATVFTNLLVSGQFIQFRNLDYVDKDCGYTTGGGNKASCAKYTGDAATMNVTNGLNKAEENKEFYSLFVSKPFGENQLGRVNNIIIYEEGGGYWNRLDAEYTLSDEIVLTGEFNHYWGDEDTTFGQFNNSSNIQVGIKYIIE